MIGSWGIVYSNIVKFRKILKLTPNLLNSTVRVIMDFYKQEVRFFVFSRSECHMTI